jgi:hypothetical protein
MRHLFAGSGATYTQVSITDTLVLITVIASE